MKQPTAKPAPMLRGNGPRGPKYIRTAPPPVARRLRRSGGRP